MKYLKDIMNSADVVTIKMIVKNHVLVQYKSTGRCEGAGCHNSSGKSHDHMTTPPQHNRTADVCVCVWKGRGSRNT